ncbi:TetR/AcrR family transcriptional regulator [Nocardioides sp. CER19]|uniref:TetR/AcrR family transcriptional regulator n=1 Tax=Nocardioides sp. CER19 TaxID=3038538 RepID=UPI0024470EFB|nr:TetR/AcrR family transcriptional regulator [Nocardioides sp. CER19]MDH2414564.1 TetR/AcrR family transcriptional regulator [Nocardioides sp. CER19]
MAADDSTALREPSARETELLDAAYAYVLEQGLSDLSLRPLAGAIGSSPRVLLFLFGSKDGLIRRLLARAREDELAWLQQYDARALDLPDTVRHLWEWLAAPEHDRLLRLWVEAYGRSLVDPAGPWAEFAAATVEDWLRLLGRSGDADPGRRTLALATLRGALLDLLATGERSRTTSAVTLLATLLEEG